MNKVALALVAHPDDVEFMMAGTLMLLGEAGYDLHCMNVANGSCGSTVGDAASTAATRLEEARAAAAALGASHHPPLVDDIMIYYTPDLLARVAAVIREIRPEILLLLSPLDYMEDHTNAARLGVTAAFCRGMPNFATVPPVPAIDGDIALYHALPGGLRDQLRNPVMPHFAVDISSVMSRKRDALSQHASQREWLDASQGLDSYVDTMQDWSAEVGRKTGRFEYAEGWQRHDHRGFGPEDFDPLGAALAAYVHEFARKEHA